MLGETARDERDGALDGIGAGALCCISNLGSGGSCAESVGPLLLSTQESAIQRAVREPTPHEPRVGMWLWRRPTIFREPEDRRQGQVYDGADHHGAERNAQRREASQNRPPRWAAQEAQGRAVPLSPVSSIGAEAGTTRTTRTVKRQRCTWVRRA